MSNDKLKPCPFCGDDHAHITSSGVGVVYVECAECGSSCCSSDTEAGAADAWNTRHDAEQQPITHTPDEIRQIAVICERIGMPMRIAASLLRIADRRDEQAGPVASDKDDAELFRWLLIANDWGICEWDEREAAWVRDSRSDSVVREAIRAARAKEQP